MRVLSQQHSPVEARGQSILEPLLVDVHNAPVRPLLAFAGLATDELDRQHLDTQHVPLALAVDDRDGALMLTAGDPSHPATLSQSDQFLTPVGG